MSTTYVCITVYFDDPFWAALYERETDGMYTVCKLVFGAEPKDYEVYAYLSEHWRQMKFPRPVPSRMQEERTVSPKRRQREIRRALARPAASTKAQQALSLAREQGKEARRKKNRAERALEKEQEFELRKSKRKEKHKGH